MDQLLQCMGKSCCICILANGSASKTKQLVKVGETCDACRFFSSRLDAVAADGAFLCVARSLGATCGMATMNNK